MNFFDILRHKVPKNFILFLIFIFSLLISTSCSKKTEKADITIYTSLYPLEQFTKWIIPEANINRLIPQGVDPHYFEPSLKDIQKLYTAKMIIYLGNTDIDRWIDKIKNDLIQRGVKVIRLQDHINFKTYSSGNEIDPHVWLDPQLSIEILKIIRDVAKESFPDKREIYEKNFSRYLLKLKELDEAYRKNISNCNLKDVITTHEFLNYLSARYDFNAYFIVHEPDEEPSLKKIKKLKELIKKNSIKYIITEPEGEKIARVLSEETKVEILPFNTLHSGFDKDYFEIMYENLKILKKALICDK
ncbi:MAG: zinc ABC transporter substrate-binding protein [Thermodesulfovibrio sp.]|uniref:metal ABC transporter solute-binding protein, Zn/Mn family n=1 Tax=Thermodesulfovibrio sp. N1 TaxID=1871110 RepID=UPI00083A483C|nr:zinc ABC transporter substrate-binding protein [Thermodesulfovibrio sp. N1]MDI6713610.1 zinc ABC transporter substrate-binding protein [Thermodesulfovibrio sp.]ODA44057.1 putative zinc-binding lipoprotein ZinT [Thermodesulfovibrio sp. N1]